MMNAKFKNRAVALIFLLVLPVFFMASFFIIDFFQVSPIYATMIVPPLVALPTIIIWHVLRLFAEKKMNKNQITVFWSMFIGFCVSATLTLQVQGAFNEPVLGSNFFWVVIYLLVAALMYIFVKSKPRTIDRWCGEKVNDD